MVFGELLARRLGGGGGNVIDRQPASRRHHGRARDWRGAVPGRSIPVARPSLLRCGGSGSASAVPAEVCVLAIAASRFASSTSSAVALSAAARAAASCCSWSACRAAACSWSACRPVRSAAAVGDQIAVSRFDTIGANCARRQPGRTKAKLERSDQSGPGASETGASEAAPPV